MSAVAQIESVLQPAAGPGGEAAGLTGAIARVQPITTTRALQGPFDYLLPEEMRGAVGRGSTLVVPFGRREMLGVVAGLADRSDVEPARLLEPVRLLEPGLPPELVDLAEWIAAEYCSTVPRALNLLLPANATRRLSGRKRRAVKAPVHPQVGISRPEPPELTLEQQLALEPLLEALRSGGARRLLLHGVTGSGKTEIYLRAAAAALEQGRGAIVLVPEIALTPQIVARFRERFGETVAVLHSRLTAGQRYEQWRRLREGEAAVCVGPRSAVFAPVQRLGLIVVDEEHDSSYKHEGDPRYDAREVAAERATQCGALLLQGSATPRPESVRRNATISLPRRVDGGPMPPVSVLDMRELPPGLHPVTSAALTDVRDEGGKAIVLLNRRGWSNFLSCRTCGRVWVCPDCDVALVLHRAAAFLACHHCGHREQVPSACPDCASTAVARHGAGTERLEHDLAHLLDDGRFPIFRLDADVLGAGPAGGAGGGGGGAGPGDPAALLQSFQEARSGALIGTQMVAKGHDFPDVRLAVVLDADATLRFPDFRAEERTFSLIAQLAGRAGRGGEGRVLVQTNAPQARSIRHAAAHDSEGFLAGELSRREALRYPPFSHLIRIVCSAEQTPPARAAAQEVRDRVESLLRAGAEGGAGAGAAGDAIASVLGPASLFRLRGRERQVIVLKAASRRPSVRAVGEAVARTAADRRHAGVSFSVDVDPQ